MLVRKSLRRNVVTLAHGAFLAQETVRACADGCAHPSGKRVIFRCRDLARLVPPGGIYGYDLEVHVGLERHLRHRQREEVRAGLLDEHGISLSAGQASRLAARFLRHLEALHGKRAPQLAEALREDGGYPMHVDATGEDGRGTALVVYNSWRQWVLGAWKLSTERADLVLPRMRQVALAFGKPCAIMRDLGRAMIQAAEQLVLEMGWKVPVLGCHTHLLRDVGKDLMEASYDQLRDLVRRHRLRTRLGSLARGLGRRLSAELPELRDSVESWARSATGHALPSGADGVAFVRSLAQWPLDYLREGDGLGFPFDRPYLDFYRRCRTVRRAADACLRKEAGDARARRELLRLARLLDPVLRDPAFPEVAARLARRADLFERLRGALRLHLAGDDARSTILPLERAAAELQDVRRAVESLERNLRRRRPERGPAQDARQAIDIVLDHLDRHRGSLWGHAIPLPKETGSGIRLVDRTNNALERLFRAMKQGERRRSGRKVLSYDFERLPAGAALVSNLTRPDYVKILCGSLDRLPEAFAELDAAERDGHLAASGAHERPATEENVLSRSLPYEDRALIRSAALRSWILSAAQSRAPTVALSPP
ncbi:MAG: hypothetical protein AB1734_09935 [Elusimicrobiota bacterium]